MTTQAATPSRRTRLSWTALPIAVAAVLLLVAIGWAHERRPALPESAQIVSHVPPCPGPGDIPGGPLADLPQAGSVPQGFVPVTVWTCSVGETSTILDAPPPYGNPVGTEVEVREARTAGDLTKFLAALSQRSQPQRWFVEAWWGAEIPHRQPDCAWGYVCHFPYWLVDRDGRAIRPAIPTLRNGTPDPAVFAAADRLTDTETVVEHLRCPLLNDADVKPWPGERVEEIRCQPKR